MKKILVLILLLGWISASNAQDLVADFLKKNNDPKIFTQVNISSKMFQMISEITDADTESLIRNLTGMKILSTEKEAQRYFGEALDLLNRKDGYEELMSILEEGEDVRIFIREKNKVIIELVILVGGSQEEFVLMNFCGVIDLKKISKLTQAVNIEGMEYLNKIDKNEK